MGTRARLPLETHVAPFCLSAAAALWTSFLSLAVLWRVFGVLPRAHLTSSPAGLGILARASIRGLRRSSSHRSLPLLSCTATFLPLPTAFRRLRFAYSSSGLT